jgi:hypothetical protein
MDEVCGFWRVILIKTSLKAWPLQEELGDE